MMLYRPCFWVSLLFIGFMVVIITDLSSIFGCLVGLKDEVTAITIVTFGTSQIDLFATKISAINDPTADNSIGNVVAANAIGVFLGLGFPWLVASIYWHFVDPSMGFNVPASDLSFLVLREDSEKVDADLKNLIETSIGKPLVANFIYL